MQTKTSEAAFSAVLRTLIGKCRSETASDVISGVALYYVGTDVAARFGDSRLNNGRIIALFVRPDPLFALLCSI